MLYRYEPLYGLRAVPWGDEAGVTGLDLAAVHGQPRLHVRGEEVGPAGQGEAGVVARVCVISVAARGAQAWLLHLGLSYQAVP